MRDRQAQLTEVPAGRVEQRGPGVFHPGVDPGRAGLVDHDRDAELLGLGEHREGEHRVGRGPVLVHRVELQAAQAEFGHGPLELADRRPGPAVGGVDRRVADEHLRLRGRNRRDVVVALLRRGRAGHAGDPVAVDRADQLPVEELRRHRQDHDLVEAGVVADGFTGPDDREAPPAVAARLPLLLGGGPVRRQLAEAAVDAQRALAAVLGGELGVLGQAQDVRVRVDQHGGAPPARATPDLTIIRTPAAAIV